MNAQLKKQIIDEVIWLSRKRTQSYVAGKAQVSTATISKIVNNDLELINDRMWLHIQSNLKIDPKWNIALTSNLEEVYNHCYNAQNEGLHLCISDHAGKGKTTGYEYYDRRNDNVYHIECSKMWTQKVFLKQLLLCMGKRPEGTSWQMRERLDKEIRNTPNALMIFDQCDHLKENQFNMIMDFCNDYRGRLAILISGVKHLRKKMDRGVQREKGSYDETASRFGRRYISLDPISLKDVALICRENGLTDAGQIQTIYDTCGGDFRRVRQSVLARKVGNRPHIKLSEVERQHKASITPEPELIA